MKVPIFKAEKASGRAACKGPQCSQLPQYISIKGKIIKDTLCAVVTVQTSETKGCLYQHFYCGDCVHWLFKEAQKNFYSPFWLSV